METLKKLTKDLKESARLLTDQEARYLVDAYYTMQDNRIRVAAQVRETIKTNEPNETLQWFFEQNELLENEVKKALDAYSLSSNVGKWMRAQYGIGPVIAAGLLAHIDIHQAPTAGHIWSYAGLDPTKSWQASIEIEKMIKECDKEDSTIDIAKTVATKIGRNPDNIIKLALKFTQEDDPDATEPSKKSVGRALKMRPHNAQLKTLCWKIGESFVKVSGNPKSLYGNLYSKQKEFYQKKNESGGFKEAAERKLEKFSIGKGTEAYKFYSKGQLPPAHIHAMAKRYAVKMFLSHLQEVWYKDVFKKAPPKPFAISILKHAHYIPPETE